MSGAAAESVLARQTPTGVVSHEAAGWLFERLARFRASTLPEGALRLFTAPVPAVRPEALLGALPREASIFWAPPAGALFAGFGCAHLVEVEGAERLGQLRRGAEALWRLVATESHPTCRAPRPRLFGGLAFEAGWSSDEAWKTFGDGAFALPRLLYRVDGAEASLTVAAGAEKTGERPVEAQLEALLEALEKASSGEAAFGSNGSGGTNGNDATAAIPRLVPMDPRAWARQVEAIRTGIRRGRFAKVVAAGRAEVLFDGRLDPVLLLGRLGEQIRSTRYAFFRPQATFLGATPERLVAKNGNGIETEALAGSIAVKPGHRQAERLIGSSKDQLEHALVVRHIVERLQPLCRNLGWSDRPQVRALRNVLHLLTPIRGELREPAHILDLVEALHPTPAVGGVPSREAIRWIVEHEAAERGWYTGPVGWFDAAGDGELAVALRSCVLQGSRAFVYAGGGIVEDSNPGLEYLETELKQRAVLAALGVGE